MDAARIVVRKVQRECCLQIGPFLRETTRETRQPSHAHTHRQILTLNVRRANLAGLWMALDRHWDGFDDLSWAITLSRFFV
jgi:hypothetical protein